MATDSTKYSVNDVRLAGGEHAIEVFALAFEWLEPLEEPALTAIAQAFTADKELATLLPGKRVWPAVRFKIASKGLAVRPDQGQLVDFIRAKPDGTDEWVISVRPDFLASNCRAYSGWKATKKHALSMLSPLVAAAIQSGAQIKAIGVEYVDAFRWNPNLKLLPTILNPQSSLLPPKTFLNDDLWHVHQGWFSTGLSNRKALNNLNIELQQESDDLLLKIHGQHRLLATTVSGSTSSFNPEEYGDVAEQLHKNNKDVLLSILTSEMVQRIGMKP